MPFVSHVLEYYGNALYCIDKRIISLVRGTSASRVLVGRRPDPDDSAPFNLGDDWTLYLNHFFTISHVCLCLANVWLASWMLSQLFASVDPANPFRSRMQVAPVVNPCCRWASVYGRGWMTGWSTDPRVWLILYYLAKYPLMALRACWYQGCGQGSARCPQTKLFPTGFFLTETSYARYCDEFLTTGSVVWRDERVN